MIRSSDASVLRIFKSYTEQLHAFSPNARLYLVNVVFTGAAMGIFRLLFNFYILSLGYNQVLLGNLVTASSLAALVLALPAGYLSDRIGRKMSLLASGGLASVSILGMVIWPETGMLYSMNFLFGFAQSLAAVTMAPFLMENSGESERTYLFSFSFGLQMASGFLGSWVGGNLPTWVAGVQGVSPTASTAYAISLVLVAVMGVAGLLPLLLLKRNYLSSENKSAFTPLSYAREHPVQLTKLILPMLLTSIGAGLIMPFMNVFFREVHHQPDPVIGSLFAWGSLAMGIGLMLAPPLADRMGKIELVVVTQGLSIPFLILLGFSPWYWLAIVAYFIRLTLMNMSGPVYETFVMEHVEAQARATVASLVSMAWNFGWAFSPMISGWMQANYSFKPAYMGTILLYSVSVILYWAFFLKEKEKPAILPVAGD